MGNSNQNHTQFSLSQNQLKNQISTQIQQFLHLSQEKPISQLHNNFTNPYQFKPTEKIPKDERLLFLTFHSVLKLLESKDLNHNINIYSTLLVPPTYQKVFTCEELTLYLSYIEKYSNNQFKDQLFNNLFPEKQSGNISFSANSSDSDSSFRSSEDDVKKPPKMFVSASKNKMNEMIAEKRRSSLSLGRLINTEKISSNKLVTIKFVDSILKSSPVKRQFMKDHTKGKNEVRSSTVSTSRYLNDKRNSIKLNPKVVSTSSAKNNKCSSNLEKLTKKGQLFKYSDKSGSKKSDKITSKVDIKKSLKKNSIRQEIKLNKKNLQVAIKSNNIVFKKNKTESSLKKCVFMQKEVKIKPTHSDKKNKTLNEKTNKFLGLLNDQMKEKTDIHNIEKTILKRIKIDIRKLEADTEAEEELNILNIRKMESGEFHLDISTIKDQENTVGRQTVFNKKFLTIPKEYPYRQRRSFEEQKVMIDPVFARHEMKHKTTTKQHSVCLLRSLIRTVDDENENRKSDVCFPRYKVDLNPLNSDLTYNEKLEVFRNKNEFLFRETEEDKALKEKLKALSLTKYVNE